MLPKIKLTDIIKLLLFCIIISLCFNYFLGYFNYYEPYENYNINDLNRKNKVSKETNNNLKNELELEEVDNKEKLIIKKTNKYNLILKTKKFSVWEPKSIDDFFPIGQVITESSEEPKESSILVNTTNTPSDYVLITYYKKYGICKPVGKNTNSKNKYISYIFSKTKPSINRIRGINIKFLKESNASNIITSFKNIADEHYNIWNINNSNYFIININNINNNTKFETVYSINQNLISPSKLLIVKNTIKYKKIYDNSEIYIWRPIPDTNYRSMGDIVLNESINPNNNLETPTIYKDFTNPILYFDSEPITINTNKNTKNKNTKNKNTKNKNTKNKNKQKPQVKIWKPVCKDGYISVGNVVTTDNKEPKNKYITSIPLEYADKNESIKNVWNSQSDIGTRCNIWSNNNFCNAYSYFTKPKENLYKLNDSFIENEADISDTSKGIILDYTSQDIKLELENLKKIIKDSLSRKLDIIDKRIKIPNIDKLNRKIYITIKPKPINSIENTTKELFNELQDIIHKKNISIKYNNLEILKITKISVIDNNEDSIHIDNKVYLDSNQ